MSSKYPSISAKVLYFIAWHNLMHKKLRTFLTVFGIVIGIGAIFFLLSFGVGLQRLVTNQVVGNQSIKTIDVSTPNTKVISLNREAYDKIKNLPHVVQIGASYTYAGHLKSSGSTIDTIVYGTDDNYLKLSNVTLSAGRSLEKNDEKAVIINMASLRAIGVKEPKQALNKRINIRIPLSDGSNNAIEHEYEIIGVSNEDDSGTSSVWIPAGIFASGGIKNFTQIKLEADNSRAVKDLRSQIGTLGLQTTSPIDTVDQINQVFQFFNVVLAGFGVIGMIVAVLGMFNTMTISLLERTKEIGLMIALGGRNRDMRKLFIFEAVLLSLIGALAGIAGAVVLGQIVNLIMNFVAKRRGVVEGFQLFAIPWWLVIGSILFMLIIGLLVVFAPARRASRINPIDALRRE